MFDRMNNFEGFIYPTKVKNPFKLVKEYKRELDALGSGIINVSCEEELPIPYEDDFLEVKPADELYFDRYMKVPIEYPTRECASTLEIPSDEIVDDYFLKVPFTECSELFYCYNMDFSNSYAETLQYPNTTSYLRLKEEQRSDENIVLNYNIVTSQFSKDWSTLLSCATSSIDNKITFLYRKSQNRVRLYTDSVYYEEYDFNLEENTKYNLSIELIDGIYYFYLDNKLIHSKSLTNFENFNIILGQEQDAYDGGFDENQCFIGHYSNFYIFKRNISDDERKLLSEQSEGDF
jgi:hypothetical protein